jgi:hypothetical protein
MAHPMYKHRGGYKTPSQLSGAAPFAKTQAGGRRRHKGTRKGSRRRSSSRRSSSSAGWNLNKFFQSLKG